MAAPTRFTTAWRKSSHSGGDANCVEIAFGDDVIGVRDSKNPAGGHLSVPRTAFTGLLARIKAGEFHAR